MSRNFWRRLSGAVATALCAGLVTTSAGHPMHIRIDQPRPLVPVVRISHPVHVQLDAWESNGGGGTGGSGGAARVPARLRAYRWATDNARGCWYVWAGAGPCSAGYDCSGLVMRAWEAAGVSLPHNVAAMLGSGKLRRISARDARRGDLAIWGDYHVELVAYLSRWTFGAQQSGTRVWWHRVWGSPAYYRVV
jgi:hypothetical protein